jgi:hypothetical protein
MWNSGGGLGYTPEEMANLTRQAERNMRLMREGRLPIAASRGPRRSTNQSESSTRLSPWELEILRLALRDWYRS